MFVTSVSQSKFVMLMTKTNPRRVKPQQITSLLVYWLGYGPFKAEGGVRFPGGEHFVGQTFLFSCQFFRVFFFFFMSIHIYS